MTSIARSSQTLGGAVSGASAGSDLRSMENAWNLATAAVKASGTATQGATASEAVQSAYRDVLGRDADAGGMAYFRDQSAAGVTPSQVRAAIAASAEAAAGINAVYQQVLGRDADAGGRIYFESALARGATLADVRSALAHSEEAKTAINAAYQQMLGRDVDAGSLAWAENSLASGKSLTSLSIELGVSDEAAARAKAAGVDLATLSAGGLPSLTRALNDVVAATPVGASDDQAGTLSEIMGNVATALQTMNDALDQGDTPLAQQQLGRVLGILGISIDVLSAAMTGSSNAISAKALGITVGAAVFGKLAVFAAAATALSPNKFSAIVGWPLAAAIAAGVGKSVEDSSKTLLDLVNPAGSGRGSSSNPGNGSSEGSPSSEAPSSPPSGTPSGATPGQTNSGQTNSGQTNSGQTNSGQTNQGTPNTDQPNTPNQPNTDQPDQPNTPSQPNTDQPDQPNTPSQPNTDQPDQPGFISDPVSPIGNIASVDVGSHSSSGQNSGGQSSAGASADTGSESTPV